MSSDRRLLMREWLIGSAILLPLLVVLVIATYYHTGEDAYITFRYARNLATGRGLVYNPGEHVEGYSNLLWTLILAGFQWIGLGVENASKWLSTAFFGLLVSFAAWIALALRDERDEPRWLAWLLPVAVLMEPLLHYHNGQGLETVSYASLLGCALLAVGGGAPLVLAGVFAALATMSRPEGIGFAIALAPAVAIRAIHQHRSPSKLIFVYLSLPVAVFLAQMAFRRLTYHEWVPNTVIAKHGGPGAWREIVALVCSRAFVPAIGAAGALLALREKTLRPLAVGVICSLAAGVAFQLISGVLLNVAFRYLVPVLVPSLVGAWLLVVVVARGAIESRSMSLVAAILIMLPMPMTLISQRFPEWFRGNTDAPRSRFHARLFDKTSWRLGERWAAFHQSSLFINAEVGRWVAANLPKDVLLAADQMGQLGWFAPQPIIDMLGLMDRHVAHDGISIAYLKERRPAYIILESCDGSDYWPSPWRLQPNVPGLRPFVTEPGFAALYVPRWFLVSRLPFSKLGFMVYVRRDLGDGKAMETVPIGVDETTFEKAWRVL